ELSDPKAKVEFTLDGDEIRLNDAGKITRIKPGEHKLLVRGDGFETETKEFLIKRGDVTRIRVLLKRSANPAGAHQARTAAARTRLAGLLARGTELIRFGKFGELGPLADEALKIDAESPGALALRATFRASVSDSGGAASDAEKSLRLNP